jgi:hypothetical protein
MRRKTLLVIVLLSTVVNLAVVFFRKDVALFYINARAGCWPWSPKVVPYHEGMTICPGQAAMVPFVIPFEVPVERQTHDGKI